MKRVLALFLSLQVGLSIAGNSIIAIVDEDVITLQTIELELKQAKTFDEKIAIIEQQIENTLQLRKVIEFDLYASQQDINGALLQLAKNNNVSIEQLQSYPQFPLLIQDIINRLSIFNLQKYITKDLNFNLSDDEINNCTSNFNDKDTKQIRIAQIIISQVDDLDVNADNQEQAIRNFLTKLSDHISKGGSFDAFAKIHSQHPSYVNGGLTEWIFVNNPTIEMLDLLEDGEISKIYTTDVGWAIAIKVDERYININLENCKDNIIYQKAQQFYSNWLKDLRNSAYIEIYTNKL